VKIIRHHAPIIASTVPSASAAARPYASRRPATRKPPPAGGANAEWRHRLMPVPPFVACSERLGQLPIEQSESNLFASVVILSWMPAGMLPVVIAVCSWV
jgi:hypothetical protein